MFSFLLILPLIGSVKSESYPERLSDDEERKYLLLMSKGDKEARSKLIEHNLRLVAHIAKKYENTKEDKDDILSIGILGLIKGIDTFNFENNNKLSTYCSRCIENEILMTLRANKNKRNYVYLFEPIGEDKEGNSVELIDLIKDDEENILDKLEHNYKINELRNSLKILTSRELEIIELRYGINNKKSMTQKEIAKSMSISRSYVSRIEKRALMKLYLYLIESKEKENLDN